MTLTELENKTLDELAFNLSVEKESIMKALVERSVCHRIGYCEVSLDGIHYIKPKDPDDVEMLFDLMYEIFGVRARAESVLGVKEID